MACQRNVLRGVSDKSLRQTIETLVSEGWSVQRTNGSHIKLTHKDAPKPVFSSSTPSVYRGTKNLVSECRRALRKTEMTKQAVTADHSQEKREVPQRRKKRRWTDEERAARLATQMSCPEGTAETTVEEGVKTEKDPAKNMETAPHTSCIDKATDMIETKMNVETAEAVTPETAPAPASTPAPAAASDDKSILNVLPADILSVAVRLVKGELGSIDITPDMVGKTIVLDGRAWIADAGSIPSPVVGVSTPAVAGEIADASEMIREGSGSDKVMEVLKAFPDTWLTTRQIADLIDSNGKNPNTHSTYVRQALSRLHKRGLAMRMAKAGTSKSHRQKYVYKLKA